MPDFTRCALGARGFNSPVVNSPSLENLVSGPQPQRPQRHILNTPLLPSSPERRRRHV